MLIHPSTGTGIKVSDAPAEATGSSTHSTATSRGKQTKKTDESHESRRVETGHDLLDNNGVNLLMATTMSVGAMVIAGWVWQLDISQLLA